MLRASASRRAMVGALLGGAVCLAGATPPEIVVEFDAMTPGEFVSSYTEQSVMFRSDIFGQLGAIEQPGGDIVIYEATSAPPMVVDDIYAELPTTAMVVSATFTYAVANSVVLVGYDSGYEIVDVAFADGSGDPLGKVSISVVGPGIRIVTMGGAGPSIGAVASVRYQPDTVCGDADLALPFGELDFADVLRFLELFGQGNPAVDVAAPFGVLDYSDVFAFLVAFGGGC